MIINTNGLWTSERIKYWEYALPIIIEAHKDTGYFLKHSFNDNKWMSGTRIGGFTFSCSANNKKSRVELDLSAQGKAERNRSAFDYLYARKNEIELEFGDALHWDGDNYPNSCFITHWDENHLSQ